MKIKINGGNRMSLIEKDIVLTTDEAIEYLKISKPTFLKYIRLGRIKENKKKPDLEMDVLLHPLSYHSLIPCRVQYHSNLSERFKEVCH
jgi:hypothetical protein